MAHDACNMEVSEVFSGQIAFMVYLITIQKIAASKKKENPVMLDLPFLDIINRNNGVKSGIVDYGNLQRLLSANKQIHRALNKEQN